MRIPRWIPAPLLVLFGAVTTAGCGDDATTGGEDAGVVVDLARAPRPDFALKPGSCLDNMLNQDESDVDCGGAICLPCGPGKTCRKGSDCLNGSCQGGTCSAGVACDDGQLNGDETDVDCGGVVCPGCNAGRNCLLPRDCRSGHCTAMRCVACTLSFAKREEFATGVGPRAVAAADVDADGKVDLLTANYGDASITVRRRDTNGTYPAATSFGVGQGPVAMAIGDLDGDGRPDVVTANATASSVSFLHNAGKGIFNNHQEIPIEGALSIQIAEIDGDTRPDLVVATGTSVAVIRNFGQQRFGAPSYFPAGGRAVSASVADMNGDKRNDVVAASGDAAEIRILNNHGDGTLEAPLTAQTSGARVTEVLARDLDADGRTDVLAASNDGLDLCVLIASPKGGFVAKPNDYKLPLAELGPMLLADLDGDTRADLVFPGPADDKLVVSIAQGGQFPTYTPFAVGRGPAAVAAADLDGDGRIDLATVERDDDKVAVLYNRCQ